MKLNGGIDLHSDNSVVALLDEEDRLVYRKRLANDAALVLESLAPYREAITGLNYGDTLLLLLCYLNSGATIMQRRSLCSVDQCLRAFAYV